MIAGGYWKQPANFDISGDQSVQGYYPCSCVDYTRNPILQLETCLHNTVDIDALVLKHQAVSLYSADWIVIVLHF